MLVLHPHFLDQEVEAQKSNNWWQVMGPESEPRSNLLIHILSSIRLKSMTLKFILPSIILE